MRGLLRLGIQAPHNILACGVYEVIVHCKSLEEFPGCDLAPLSVGDQDKGMFSFSRNNQFQHFSNMKKGVGCNGAN